MTTPATISDDGSVLNLNRAGMDAITIIVDGVDLSNETVIFKVEGGPTVTLSADPENTAYKLLRLTVEEIAEIPKLGAAYFVRHEETGDVLMEGKVFARGFA